MSKTDKELLELAAKAAGIECDESGPFRKEVEWQQSFGCAGEFAEVYREWNPLSEDGDALRLAVDLDIDLSFDADNGTIQAAYWIDSMNFAWKEESTAGDKHAATRRAIVRAAAAIGEAME